MFWTRGATASVIAPLKSPNMMAPSVAIVQEKISSEIGTSHCVSAVDISQLATPMIKRVDATLEFLSSTSKKFSLQ